MPTVEALSDCLLLYCRPGYENDCAAEITALAGDQGVSGYCRAAAGAGHLEFHAPVPGDAGRLAERLHWRDLVFPRQWLVPLARVRGLPSEDRVKPLVEAIVTHGDNRRFSGLWLEHPDSDAGKPVASLCRGLRGPLRRGLEAAGVALDVADAGNRLHCFFPGFTEAVAALGVTARATPWHSGIPRLRQPRSAPSRSTLKLEEALLVLLDPDERETLLQPGASAVDLGAAPGGWTWQLVQRHLRVTAVDNGPLQTELLDSGLVEHLRLDGFRYRPDRPVDLLVCDMVEQPLRVAALMGRWLREGYCRAAIFNLKLPMRRRYQMVRDCLERLPEQTAEGISLNLRCRHLYHDRDEVTVAAVPGGN